MKSASRKPQPKRKYFKSRGFSRLFCFSWEQRKVQDVADRFDNLRIPVAANLRVHGTTPYYGANGIQDYVEGFTHDGEFVLVAEDGANDLKNYPVKCVNGRIWVNNHAHVLQGKAGIADNSFLAFAISQSDIESLLVGGGRAKLNAETLMSIEFRLPCLQEQYRIGEYLTQLDHLITLHQRKFEKLMNVKKSMLEKMFPQNGSCYPAVRFKEFTDPWEQWKVSDVITDIARPIELMDNQRYQMVTVKRRNEGVVSRGFMYGRDILVKNYYEVHTDDYLISKRQLVHGANGLVPESLNNAVVSNEYMVCIGNEFVSAGFLALLSKTKSLKRDFFLSSYGVDIEKLVFDVDDWKKRLIVLPTIDEQNKICAYFRCLDNLITLHQRELEKLQSIKKALLEKMFV